MFKFDFHIEDIESENPFTYQSKSTGHSKSSLENDSRIKWYDAEEIFPSKECLDIIDVCKLNSIQKDLGTVKIHHMISGFLLEDIKDNETNDLDIKKAEQQHSDLIPGVYEGGAKIWECTEDLLTYLSKNFANNKLKNAHVLDLGCGSGLLGIFAFVNGARVTFQDYNRDVLEKITIPNVLLNTVKALKSEEEHELSYDFYTLTERSVRFFSGDWAKWCQLTAKETLFDIILTSETIYNPANQQKMLNCLYDKLKSNGVALVAAKTYYFGVGGGLRQFEKLIDSDKRFTYKTVWLSSEGVNREIIELKRQQC